MENYFRVLGLTRGCDEAALKKAYHQKALALHPDRNPGGAEQFKRVNEAYEAIRTHFRRNGGHDSAGVQAAPGGGGARTSGRTATTFTFNTYYTNAGTGFQYARRAHFAEEPPHLFTEEELFGEPPGGFTYEKRYPRARSTTKPGETANNNNNNSSKNNNNNYSSSGNAKFAKAAGPGVRFTTTQMYEQADERWRRAHGDRVPVSGYSMQGGGGAAPPPYQQSQQQPQQAQAKPSPASNSFSADVSDGTWNRQGNGNGSANTNSSPSRRQRQQQQQQQHRASSGKSNNSFFANDINRNNMGNTGHDEADDDDDDGAAYNAGMSSSPESHASVDDILNEFEMQQTLHEVRREWERLKKDLDRKMTRSTPSPERMRRDRGNKFVDDDDEDNYVVHRRPEPPHREETQHYHRREQQRLDEAHMRSILEEKLQLKKVLFTQRYTPDPADVALMSDSEVYVLCELLHEVEQRMRRVLSGRMVKGLCSRCSAAAKIQDGRIFTCGHTSVCADCAVTSGICPVCAATRR
ncbi:putative chaperone DNAJ protein [Trypanosoma grayi]|uniref:putative chaperone DNAJ protein n=1 Tax=Trypanosoma grayi TaxID=71804 RepID=UPI0004F4A2D6|nr:putative chaperone DNAJ protein [Trypanosoma grayi]KEG08629.1 putative chaperone DNAJ protein [Trypanosoma grayi]